MTILGDNAFTQVATRVGWDKQFGWTTTKEFEGPRAKTDAYANNYVNKPEVARVEKDIRNGKGVVTVTWVDDDGGLGIALSTFLDNDVWEVIGQDLFKDIRAHQTFNQDNDQAALEEVREAVEKANKNFAVPANDPEKTYYKLLLRGVKEFVRSSAILRRTVVVGPNSLEVANWTGVDKAWKLRGESGSPDLRTTGDAKIIGVISSMDEYDSTKKQWLKRAPQVTQLSRRQFRITIEWWFARRWSHALYAGDNENGNP